MLKEIQKIEFSVDYELLSQDKSIHNKRNLLSLHPFLDHNNVMRVGGRLQNFNLSFSEKHQIIFSAKYKLSKLMAEYYHKKYLHVGLQALFCFVKQKFWPL